VRTHARFIDLGEIMSYSNWLAVAAAALLPQAILAQPSSQPDPANPQTAVVASPAYSSAFVNYRSANEDGDTPDKSWRAANEEMQRPGGHAGHLKAASGDITASNDTCASNLHQNQGEKGKQ
jgi:hypothetical protein